MLGFWEIDPRDRSSSLAFQEILSILDIQDDRPEARPVRQPKGLELMEGPTIDYERAQAILTQLLPPAIQIPEGLKRILSGLIRKKIEDVVAAQEKLCLDDADTQTLIDFLELVCFNYLRLSYKRLKQCLSRLPNKAPLHWMNGPASRTSV
jgi:hypothetical protein